MKPFIRFGLIMGGLLAAFPLILFAIGMDKNESIKTFSTVINLLIFGGVFYYALKEQRDVNGNGFISFGQGFGSCFKITLVASVISAASSYLYFTVVNPGFLTFMKLKQEEELFKRGMTDAEIEKISASMDAWMSPGVMVAFAFGGMLLLGVVIGLIISALMKKEDPSAEIS